MDAEGRRNASTYQPAYELAFSIYTLTTAHISLNNFEGRARCILLNLCGHAERRPALH